MRLAFPVVFSALVILGAASIASQDKTLIEVIPSTNNVRAGESLSIDVFVSAHKPVNAVNIKLSIPDTQLEVTGIDIGESVITLWTEDPYEKNGVVHLSGGTFRKGFLGKHLIATINARAINTGLAYVNVTESMLLAGDGSGTEIPTKLEADNAAKLYIANEQGQLLSLDTKPSTLEGFVDIRIVTDIDGDGVVTLADVSRFMAAWQARDIVYDFSGDGKMTFRDFAIILADSFFR